MPVLEKVELAALRVRDECRKAKALCYYEQILIYSIVEGVFDSFAKELENLQTTREPPQ